ncbi:MAG TPA: isoprenylcysteine carboxylmethyltransferase family protein [Patescibacteria group bacterium]|nr:isoprenylcysteine carboxylmethyltransferase family protein [Patescibacteria group bacterium]
MTELNKQASLGLLKLIVAMAAVTFLPAWTLDYWQAWTLLAVFLACTLAIDLYLVKNDPELLERRLKAGPGSEQEKSQKIIQALAMVAFIAIFILSALDYRFGWSVVPSFVSIIGDVLVALGLYFVFLVFKENTFTSAIIEIGDDQRVITTGPYALVRHPMYIGALVMLVGVPLALGSLWGLIAIVPMALVIVWRLLDEEKFLAANLAGYCEYQRKVRYHLLPMIW